MTLTLNQRPRLSNRLARQKIEGEAAGLAQVTPSFENAVVYEKDPSVADQTIGTQKLIVPTWEQAADLSR